MQRPGRYRTDSSTTTSSSSPSSSSSSSLSSSSTTPPPPPSPPPPPPSPPVYHTQRTGRSRVQCTGQAGPDGQQRGMCVKWWPLVSCSVQAKQDRTDSSEVCVSGGGPSCRAVYRPGGTGRTAARYVCQVVAPRVVLSLLGSRTAVAASRRTVGPY